MNRHSIMMETITVSQQSLNGGLQQSKLNIMEQHLPISYNIVPHPYKQESPFNSPYLNNSQTIPGLQAKFQNQAADDNELSIFDAQKYFNEGSEQFPNHSINKHSPASATDQYEFLRLSSVSSSTDAYSARNYRGKSFHATPTASSEASWNSQTGLLSIPPGTIKVSLNTVIDKRKKIHNPRWFFRRNCPCIGRKSLQVDNHSKTVTSEGRTHVHPKSLNPTPTSTSTNNSNTKQADEALHKKSPAENNASSSTLNALQLSPEKDSFVPSQPPLRISLTAGCTYNDGGGFSFPILKPSTTPQALNVPEEPPRYSLDAFLPPNHEISGPKRTTPNLIEDDTASDGSSDLFEIESFSTQTTTYQMYSNNNNFRRDSLDEASTFRNPRRLSVITSTSNNYRRNSLDEPATPSVAATEGYEPSEASIEWSVTTVEGFDRSSVTTCEDMMMTMAAVEREDGGGGRRNSGSRGNGLLGLGCRSEKAVMVGPGPRRVGQRLVSGEWVYNKPPLAGRPNQVHRG